MIDDVTVIDEIIDDDSEEIQPPKRTQHNNNTMLVCEHNEYGVDLADQHIRSLWL